MSLFKDRLRERRKALGLSQKQLAKKAKVSQTTISDIERDRNKGSSEIAALAHALQCSALWLAEGRGKPPVGEIHLNQIDDVESGVPLLSWDKLDPELSENQKYVNITLEENENTFALKVTGASMEPVFKDGSTIIVDKGVEAKNGDFVITQNSENKVGFSQLLKDGSSWFLSPLNSRYPIAPLEGHTVVGVVTQAIIKFK